VTLDALELAEIGDRLRDAVTETFWDWFDDTQPHGQHLTDEQRSDAMRSSTCWLNRLSDRDFGQRMVSELELAGYKIVKTR